MPAYQITKLRLLQPLPYPINVTIKYKYYLDTSWITVVSGLSVAVDGTLSTPQTIMSLDYDKRYTIQATNLQCESIYQEDIFLPCGTEGCPEGYTLAPDGSYCYKVLTSPAIPPVSPVGSLIAKHAVQYSTCGTYIYASGFASDGTGTSTQITTSNPFWVNGAGACVDATLTDGALNRCGVWSSTLTGNQDIGFSVCVSIPTAKTYYIAVACDNYAIIKVDGVTILTQDQTAIDTQYGISGACFKVWHVYPIPLTAGVHYIEIFGHNVSSLAAVGAEIYDNTSAEIIAATSYGDLNLIFSTKDEVGNEVLLGTGGYTCPADYSLAACESPLVCKRILTSTVGC